MKLAALLLMLPIGCLADVSDRELLVGHLQEAQARWQQIGPASYAFTISNGCFCLHPPYVGPLRITVRNGKLRRAVYVGDRWGGYSRGQAVRSDTSLKATVPELFAEIENLIGIWKPEYIRAEYDPADGHPVRFEYDDPEIEDEQTDIKVVEFKRL